jgi:hypothetical protein
MTFEDYWKKEGEARFNDGSICFYDDIAHCWQASAENSAKEVEELKAKINATIPTIIQLVDKDIEQQKQLAIKDIEIAKLQKYLLEAADDISDWGAYADSYLQAKHNLTANANKYRIIATDSITTQSDLDA